MIKIHFDGGKRKGGGITWGFVVFDQDNNILHQQGGCQKHTSLTTNDAEYIGLLEAMGWAHRNNYRQLEIWGDSALVISQVNGRFQVKAKNLKNHHQNVLAFILCFESVTFNWCPREDNTLADRMCRDYKEQ